MRLGRVLAVVIVAVVAATALYVGRFDPDAWRRALTPEPGPPAPVLLPEAPMVAVQPRPLGTDSSVSPVPVLLHLVATRPGRNTREGYADIGVDVHSPQTYRAGAVLVNGARVQEIYDDHVVLAREGKSTRLYVEGKAPAGTDPSAAAAAALLTVGGAPAAANAAADSAESLTEVIRVSPVYEGQRVSGLEVYANERSDVFARLGLEAGDRIQSIDGEPVGDVAAAIGTLRHLTEGQSMTVVVERAGGRRTLSLDGSIVWEALHRS